MQIRAAFLVAGVIAWAAIFVSLGLSPYSFEWPPNLRLHLEMNPRDSLRNFLAFVPFGLMIAPLLRRTPLMATGIFCIFLSLSVEIGQQFLPRRFPSVGDLVLNTLGGVFGALVILAFQRLRDKYRGGQE
jgi:glycopeptide antibiotics resistance protein